MKEKKGPNNLRRPEKSPELKNLIWQRRNTNIESERRRRSKDIQREMRMETRRWRLRWAAHPTRQAQKYNISSEGEYSSSQVESLPDRRR